MRPTETDESKEGIKSVITLANIGEPVLIHGPSNKFVIMTEDNYNELMRVKHNAEYLDMLNESKLQARTGKIRITSLEEMKAFER
ncbi:MAG: hypothetical protein LBP92_14785 [Deltaproteobacteria bacterium]|jgi:hypothetical protein|nr:hypothetical protein [Deltaproteobacteria bacterium]